MQLAVQVVDDDPRLVGHPMLSKPDWRNRAVPLVLHGDGVVFNKKSNSMKVVSMGCMQSESWSLDKTWLLVCFATACETKRKKWGNDLDTWRSWLWPRIVHGFNALYHGVHPTTDWDGSDWPAGSYQAKIAGQPIAAGEFLVYFGAWQVISNGFNTILICQALLHLSLAGFAQLSAAMGQTTSVIFVDVQTTNCVCTCRATCVIQFLIILSGGLLVSPGGWLQGIGHTRVIWGWCCNYMVLVCESWSMKMMSSTAVQRTLVRSLVDFSL